MMQRSKELVLTMTCLAAFALLGACSSPLGSLPPVSAASASEYRLQPGDELLVTIQDVAQADRSYIIDSSGTISLPLLQEVKVAGLSVREVANRIAEGFRAIDALSLTQDTNMVWVTPPAEHHDDLVAHLESEGLSACFWKPTMRFVTHLDIDDAQVEALIDTFQRFFADRT